MRVTRDDAAVVAQADSTGRAWREVSMSQWTLRTRIFGVRGAA
jgi:hypothetical protein